MALRQQILPSEEEIPVNEDDWTVDEVVVADGEGRRDMWSSF